MSVEESSAVRPLDAFAVADVQTPLGMMRLAAGPAGLCGAWFLDQRDLPAGDGRAASMVEKHVLTHAREQLAEWFDGQRQVFDLPLATQGTEFQQSVWDGLLALPFGVTVSYGELARRIGRPRAVRAVAQAVGRNPISIIIPCHRIIGYDTALTGFGGGLVRKRYLLAREGNRYVGQTARARRINDGQMDLPLVATDTKMPSAD